MKLFLKQFLVIISVLIPIAMAVFVIIDLTSEESFVTSIFNSPNGDKFDGTYDFRFAYPGPSGTESVNSPGFIIVTNSNVSSIDSTVQGTVDQFGKITFIGPCPTNLSIADWWGNMNDSALEGFNFGEGNYECRTRLGGGIGSKSWSIRGSR